MRLTLEDIKAVVVEYLNGVVVGKLAEKSRPDGGKGPLWLPLEKFTSLPDDTLCRKLHRLHAAMVERGLKRTDLATLFGVSPALITRWLKGMKPGENPGKAKRIPPDRAALMIRWIETGRAPTSAELRAIEAK